MEHKGRRQFLGNLSTLAIVGGTLPLLTAATNRPKEAIAPFRFLCPPYLQNSTQNSVHILFITNNNAHSWIEYGEADLNLKAESYLDGFVQANNTLNSIQLNNLNPGTTYKYRIVSREIVKFDPYDLAYGDTITSDTFEFSTVASDADSVTCLILNDIHDRPYSFSDLLSLNKDNNYDFVALNGDMFDYQTDEQQLIDHLITPCTTLFASEKPFIMIRGNHETRGKFARNIKDYFKFPEQEYYFSFKQGPVHWIVLDSGEDKEDETPVYGDIVKFDEFREQQAKWLDTELQKSEYSDCKYKVVLMHIPPFHSGDWHGTTHCRQVFNPVFKKYGIDMVISGHTHRYGVHPPTDDHPYPIIIGGGPKTGSRTLIQFYADQNNLEVKMIRDDGEIVGQYKL
ncbi:purple acid phosphatase family protein [Snuella sedimenti]|uniref:Metallophosphoesterase family protein n=1 Tax=Snuella sedimenti TaxID=2798802 RepID=A0A8J7LYQ3_9FLAO|nr:metallophosphoesterase family protein [Snuella sedimenti]MBJ6368801.1 metallophosphoesterase family protein [Snuella sedimenti]